MVVDHEAFPAIAGCSDGAVAVIAQAFAQSLMAQSLIAQDFAQILLTAQPLTAQRRSR